MDDILFKGEFPEKYAAGYRVAKDVGYTLPEEIVGRMKYPEKRCWHCKSDLFEARGIGINQEPHWVCMSCLRMRKATMTSG